MKEQELYAYALGYYHGRLKGESLDCFADEADTLRSLYRRGYDAGVNERAQIIALHDRIVSEYNYMITPPRKTKGAVK